MITRYRPDPKNPRRMTEEEQRRLDEAPIDYSDIPELGDEFFTKACVVTGEASRQIDWSNCPDVESVPGRCGGAWVVKGTRVMVECILDNFPDCSPEQIAHELYDLDVDTVRRILAYAGVAMTISPEEAERRRTHVRVATAENRLEGIETSDDAQAVLDAYLQGEIDARDLVKAYKAGRYKPSAADRS